MDSEIIAFRYGWDPEGPISGLSSELREKANWDPRKPIKDLDSEQIQDIFSEHAGKLYQDLRKNKLEVVLADPPEPRFEGHKIRQVENENPQWYKDLFHSIPNFNRNRSERALDRIVEKEDKAFEISTDSSVVPYRYKFDTIYRDFIFKRLVKGFEIEEHDRKVEISPDNRVREYFGLDSKEDFEKFS